MEGATGSVEKAKQKNGITIKRDKLFLQLSVSAIGHKNVTAFPV